MALHHAAPGDIVDLGNAAFVTADAPSIALFKTPEVEVIRRVLHAGQSVPRHEVDGPLILQCLAGSVKILAGSSAPMLGAGQLTYLAPAEPYALEAVQDSVLLMTIVRLAEG